MPARLFLLAAVLLTAVARDVAAEGSQGEKPNVVLIFIDDMGWKDATYTGSDLYETPNIDRLASEGMVFSSAYASAGNCLPSRACLLSGQYTPRHGVYAVWSTKRGPKARMRLEPVPNTDVLGGEFFTVGEAMKSAGYKTGMFGKWHVGNSLPTWPKAQGFDDVDAMRPTEKQSAAAGDPKWIYRITNRACEFMEENRDQPFFAFVSHHATHMGIQAREEMFTKFDEKGPGDQHKNTRFAAMNGQMDDGVGLLLAKIRELGLEEDTLVIFTSDNGGLPQSPQDPLRGFKGMYYEGGVRVPMIARWPGKIEAGSSCDTPVINTDFYPTFLAAAGHEAPAGQTLDGENLLPLFTGEGDLVRDSIFWHFPGYLDSANPGARDRHFRARPQTAIRKGDWKLHLFHEEWILDGGRENIDNNLCVELYNLANDVGERRDLASELPEKRDELLDDLLAWLEATDAKLPTEIAGSTSEEVQTRQALQSAR